MSHVRATPPVDKIDADSLTQVREYLDGEVRAAGRDEGGEEVPPAEADHQAGAEVGDLQYPLQLIISLRKDMSGFKGIFKMLQAI